MSKRSRRTSMQGSRLVAPGTAAPAAKPAARGPSRIPFVLAIILSAFLLFTVELLAGRLVLPVFGGSPGVWTTALVLFTGILFLGYLYAHIVASRLDPVRGGLVHLTVAAVVIAFTLLAPRDIASLRLPGTGQALNVLYALLLIAAAPIFLLASTTPLLSSWYSRRDGDPWWLYAVSNGGSLLALLAYPFVLQPLIPLSAQRTIVAIGLVAFVAALVVVVAGGRRRASQAPTPTETQAAATVAAGPAEAPAPLTRGRQLRWLFAACIPAGLLSATTNYIATDLVSTPLLWIGPLAIYLASFVVAFSRLGRRGLSFVEFLVPTAVTLLWIPLVLHAYLSVAALLLVELGSYAILAIAIHGRLALDRPDERHLTRFYLILSAGGLIATAFVALLAPLIFSTIYEYPILLVAGIGALAILPGPGARSERPEAPDAEAPDAEASDGDGATSATPRGILAGTLLRVLPFAIVGLLLFATVAGDPRVAPQMAILLLVGATIIALARSPGLLAGGTAVALVILAVGFAPPVLSQVRTFFGVIEVREPGGPAYAEYSGTTLHGAQFTDRRSREPTTYYVRSGPLGSVFEDLRDRIGSPSIGAVGLGVGTVAAYALPGDGLTFFEIDQAVVDIAERSKYFTYLRDSAVPARIVMGDARLSLDDEPDAAYDLLVLDAFSSDAVPAHLLTKEAMQGYVRTLRPGGVLAYHVSNGYYDLASAVVGTARSAGLDAAYLDYDPSAQETGQIAAYPSEWVVVGQPKDIERFKKRGWSAIRPGPVLTDDSSDLLRTLRSIF